MSTTSPPQSTLPGARAIVALFLLVLVTPGVGLALGFGRNTVSESELRELATFPTWSWKIRDVVSWPSRFEVYFEDHFALRGQLIDARAWLLWHGLGTSAADGVVAGRHDWLFYADDGGLDDWTQAKPFSEAELADWATTLLRRRAYLAKRGIAFVFVIAPDKQMIYTEFMPGTVRRLREGFRADTLIAYMRRVAPDFEILDLRPPLLAAKSTDLLYHHYDTHWSDRGALVAYQAIVNALRVRFPAIRALQRGDFVEDATMPSGDRTTMLGLDDAGKRQLPGLRLRRGRGYRVVEPATPDPYGEDGLLITEHQDRSLPRAIVFRDSFGARLIPYLSEHFSRVAYYWQNEFDFDAIEAEHPDMVIQEFVARHFYTYGPYPKSIPD
jgi:hypothetical protein